MKVLLVCGSPHEKGCTYTALSEVAATLQEEGGEPVWFWMGKEPLSGCVACGGCRGKGMCVRPDNSKVNELIGLCAECDGVIIGTPVHFAAASGGLTSLLDRVFYAGKKGPENPFRLKPAACVVSARRAGTTATFDQINKYFTICEMPVISARYWNMVHGNTPDEVRQDQEGMQCMRYLARNMAWFLKCKEAGKAAGVREPVPEPVVSTNFIR